ncbi:reverse transcriptase (RNA-dependent DNA polymerase) [Rhizobium sp. ERR 922]|uniref:reverse transcriptase family protein n=1 Tax=unclassified Rhizobium TaxID=2613769 RepID=UPI0011A42D73|nr:MULTISPECIES: reverse transcriptase family protein [unclassified Rhizobium]TWB50058.1 reverse transcriptase (RNA-dependent DNA polymerase) [Rhizobium sp. ERR 922]TWB92439.1 reverse transcriptase (RNA-dependent DNA polymerase) [Rhizobium sp. ERR 942]
MPPKQQRHFYKLQDSALYNVTTKKRLAEVLLCSPDDLKNVLATKVRYKNRWKPKDSDTAPWLTQPPPPEEAANYRPIDIPIPSLKRLQARIAYLLSRIEPPSFLFSPVKGLSYVDNARRHVGSRAFWLLDVADYFPSCRADRVAWFFRTEMKCAPDVAAILVALTTDKERLPQGSPCSPILAYFCNMVMWNDIATTVENAGCVLSVYADDITISGANVPGQLIWQVKKTIHKNGFRLKREKELSLLDRPADITGVIVRNGQLKLPNRQLKKLVELVEKHKSETKKKELAKLFNQIQGRLAQRKQVENAN